MKATIAKEKIRVAFSLDEIVLLGNSLNEVCNGFELPEFEKRIGTTETNGRILLRIFTKSCDEADRLAQLDDDVFSFTDMSELNFNYGKFNLEVISIAKNKIVFELSVEELSIIGNALQEACNNIEEWEFQTRTGYFPKEAQQVLSEINAIKMTIVHDVASDLSNSFC